jgi:hypothetical protein
MYEANIEMLKEKQMELVNYMAVPQSTKDLFNKAIEVNADFAKASTQLVINFTNSISKVFNK